MSSALKPDSAAKVLILCHAYWEGLSRLPRLLHASGAQVHVFGPAGNYPSLSRYVSECHTAPEEMPVFLDALQNFLSVREAPDWIVIGDDVLWYALAARQDQPWVQQVIQHAVPLSSLEMVVSKIRFIEICQSAGIRVPAFRVCDTLQTAQETAAELGFPVVVKDAQGFAGLAVQIVPDSAALARLDFSAPHIVQQFIPGQTLSACVLYQRGSLAGLFSYYRSRTWGALGPSAAIRFKVFPGLTETAVTLGRLSQFHGLCGLDLIESAQDGQLYLLEQNFRPTLTMDAGHLAGADFSDLMALMWETSGNRAAPQPRLQSSLCRQTVSLFPQDFFRAIDERQFGQIAGWLCRPWRWRWQEPRVMRTNLRIALGKLLQF